MRSILALARASWQTLVSYRLQLILSFAGLLTTVIPLYFISGALQPVMANAIKAEGGQSFGFLVIGMAVATMITVAVGSLPSAVSSGISSGVLEAMLATPTSTPQLLVGLGAFDMAWAFLKQVIFVTVAWILGANLLPGHVLPGLLVFALIILSHLPIGLIGASLVLVFRTAGPLPRVVLLASAFLGGVYYPTHVIPSWLQSISAFLPLTYGLRALRKVVLEGASLAAVIPDLMALLFAAVTLFAVGIAAITAGFRYARQHGTLAQY